MAEEEQASESQRWSSYSDYETIVEAVAERVEVAIDAYGHLEACESQMISVTNGSAIETKKALVGAGTRIKPEVRHNRDVEPFDEIWERWQGDDGHVNRLRRADFVEEVPDWLSQYVDDLTTAAWELGYLKAGREEAVDPDDDDIKIREVID